MKDVSCEFDEFPVNSHLLQAALLVLVIYYTIWVSFLGLFCFAEKGEKTPAAVRVRERMYV